jgi:hypothetical protein
MGRIKREIMALRVAAAAIRNMSDTDVCRFVEMLKIALWYPDLHASKNERYPLPQIVFKTSNPQNADIAVNEIAPKGVSIVANLEALIPSNKWVKRRVLVRAVLERMMPYLKSAKQRKAEIALQMLNVADAKHDDWKEELNDLAERFREVE